MNYENFDHSLALATRILAGELDQKAYLESELFLDVNISDADGRELLKLHDSFVGE